MAFYGQTARACLGAFAAACIVAVTAAPAHAQDATAPATADQSPAAAAFARGQSAWEKKEYDRVESAYQEAIESGGLGPDEVREAYVRLGSARALRGKNDAAVRAFRAAAVLDDFKIPPQLKAPQAKLAEQAKKDVQKMGIAAMTFTLTAPANVPPAKPFTVKVALDDRHVPVVSYIALTVKESTSNKSITKQEAPKESLELEVPAYLAPSGGQITVRVDALDKYKNRLASSESRVAVDFSETNSVSLNDDIARPKESGGRGKSIFSTPWPYVIGGLVIVGLGAAFIVQSTKADEVSLGPIQVKSN